ncbi:MAG: hypothetical protein R3B89_00515 [Polyangiaceae bacterium]
MKSLHAVALLSLVSACAGTPPPAPASPEPAPAPTPSHQPAAPVLEQPASIIPEPSAECQRLAEPVVAEECPGEMTVALAERLSTPTRLLAWESCPGVEPGLLRALVAELSPIECADVLVEPASGAVDPSPEVREVLAGLGVAARLARLAGDPPRLEPPYDKTRFAGFLTTRLAPWIVEQAKAVDSLSKRGAALHGYAKGVVAIQAGLADLRMVELMRQTKLPEEMAGDAELEEVYFAALDQALEPRKQRGRDAALVGLRRFHEVGAIADGRLESAHRLLSLLYNGRRIDRLERLMLPSLSAEADAPLAAALPSYYAGKLIPEEKLRDDVLALSSKGLPTPLQQSVEAPKGKPLPPDKTLAYALGLAHLGQRYFTRGDFERAGRVSQGIARDKIYGARARLLAALGEAMVGAPDDAAKMMLAGFGDWKPNVKGLDTLGKGRGELAGMAAFDAAFLLELAAPQGADEKFWLELSTRYGAAQKKLEGAAAERAKQRAEAAKQTADSIAGKAKSPDAH